MLRLAPTLLAPALLLTAAAHAGVTFGPPKIVPGKTVRLLVRSEVVKGTLETSSPSGRSAGAIKILRERDLFLTRQKSADDGSARAMIRVPKFESTTTIDLGGVPDTTTERSPLTGMQLAASKDSEGTWTFTGDGKPIGAQAKAGLEELTAYQSRNWFPDYEVNIGDTWEFDPAWLRLVIQRDLKDAQMLGTMKLRQIRRSTLAQFAVVDIDIRSSGAELDSTGRSTGATVALKGEARINLKNMLDEKLELTGTIDMQTHDGAKRTTFHLPVRMSATKSIERPGSRPSTPRPLPNTLPPLPGPNNQPPRELPNTVPGLPKLPPITPDRGPAIPRLPKNSL